MEAKAVSRPRPVQGKPVARRGRKARDLARDPSLEDRPVAGPKARLPGKVEKSVKANLARFTVVLTMALAFVGWAGGVLTDGMRWSLFS